MLGLNPLLLQLHYWQADSLQLSHLGISYILHIQIQISHLKRLSAVVVLHALQTQFLLVKGRMYSILPYIYNIYTFIPGPLTNKYSLQFFPQNAIYHINILFLNFYF